MVKTAKVEPGANVVVFGLGGIGLNVIQGARLVGANKIVGVDINPAREEWGRKFGMTDFINAKGKDRAAIIDEVLELTDGGADYTFDATGNTEVMRTALECCHRGWGTSIIIGVAEAGKEIATRPFQLVTGRNWRGTAFGGAKGRTDVPKIVDWYMDGKIAIDPMITHTLTLDEINQGFDLMHAGESIRCGRHLLREARYVQPCNGRVERRRALETLLRRPVRQGGQDRRQGPAELRPARRGVHGVDADRRRAGDAMPMAATIGFDFDSPEEVDAWHAAGCRGGRHGDARTRPAGARMPFGRLYLAYLRDPDGNKLCGLHRPPQ